MVTVIITSYNAAPFLAEAIKSALAQTYRQREVIVVDDGSTDGSADVALRFAPQGVRVVRQANQGPAGSLNTGLQMATGDYVSILDGDDVWRPEKLESHVECFESHPDADLTFTWSDWIDQEGRLTGLHTNRCEGAFDFESLFEDFVIGNTSSVAIRRSSLETSGLCDLKFSRYYDVDLFLRIARGGPAKVRAIPRALTLYRRHTGQMSRDWKAMQSDWKNLNCKHANAASPRVRARAAHNMARYFAFLAYETGSFGDACSILRRTFAEAPALFASDIRNWKLAAALASAIVLPRPIHSRLESLAKRVS